VFCARVLRPCSAPVFCARVLRPCSAPVFCARVLRPCSASVFCARVLRLRVCDATRPASPSPLCVACRSFRVVLRDAYVFVNDDATRTFVGVAAVEGKEQVRALPSHRRRIVAPLYASRVMSKRDDPGPAL
jgi:hypothetical protein